MHPERELYKIQQNNPLSEELKEQILAIDGVKEIEVQTTAQAAIQEVLEEGKPMETFPTGIEDGALEELKKYVVEGSLDDAKLKDGKELSLIRMAFYYPKVEKDSISETRCIWISRMEKTLSAGNSRLSRLLSMRHIRWRATIFLCQVRRFRNFVKTI